MVFCLPLWVAFPSWHVQASDWERREQFLTSFEQIVQNYRHTREESGRTEAVRSILVLTMADDPRSSLATLHERWIAPYLEASDRVLEGLRSAAGITRYLADASRVSEALHDELLANLDPRLSSIPQTLNLGSRPWLIPASSISGARLEQVEAVYRKSAGRLRLPAPTPAHVELPLLVALCDRTNALL